MKQKENIQMLHGCVISTVATDARVLKRQAISIHNAKYLSYSTSFIKDVPSTVNTIKNWNYLFLQKLHNLRVKKKNTFRFM